MLKKSKNKKYLGFVILVGGKSSRFGSDKGIYKFLGKPLINYQLDVLIQFNLDIFIVAHSKNQIQKYIDASNYTDITAFILDDKSLFLDEHIHSPMIGLYSAFKELNELHFQKGFALSCDMPLIKPEIIRIMLQYSKDYDCCIPIWNNNYLEPLFAIYPIKKALNRLSENINAKTLKLINIIDENWRIKYVSVEKEIQPLDKDLVSFFNINHSDDIEKLKRLYQNS